ncbi:MAG: hypothetical protein ACPHAN_02880 [Pseudomonadales bacterium]
MTDSIQRIPLAQRAAQILFRAGLLSLGAMTFLFTSCTSTEIVTANSAPPVQLVSSINDSDRLDILVLPFDPNLDTLAEANQGDIPISADVRRAESRYIAFHLKDTLEQTGNWGIVRVVPSAADHHAVTVTGTIIESDGEQLHAEVTAKDATGRLWFSRTYQDIASKYGYQSLQEDPFQDFYNDIANDLVRAYQSLSTRDIRQIQQVANLQFAANLAPLAFEGYLTATKRGEILINQLPASNDASMLRVNRLRAQDDLLTDTLDDFYLKFYRDIKPSYDEWRYATYDEAIRLRQMNKQARNRLLTGAALIAGGIYAGSQSETWAADAASAGAVMGGITAIKSGLDRRKQTEIHEQALQELTQSLSLEIAPNVLDIEGETRELTGSAERQYAQWRDILAEIYREERGGDQNPKGALTQ